MTLLTSIPLRLPSSGHDRRAHAGDRVAIIQPSPLAQGERRLVKAMLMLADRFVIASLGQDEIIRGPHIPAVAIATPNPVSKVSRTNPTVRRRCCHVSASRCERRTTSSTVSGKKT